MQDKDRIEDGIGIAMCSWDHDNPVCGSLFSAMKPISLGEWPNGADLMEMMARQDVCEWDRLS